ncbi:hypothetical cytosolic protein [Syntrophus aciditrophicus SB]|jgi:hypothetical protein|uniref:Hypothetical cytosolic protein n=1 Tax=Syntrophus aciditrophicus (strain SB) TaxID=56780 RepID=Q2LRG5_SYNAS|nr:hypothetical cytosolic protein [Syntrophus aciditrophicus SB]OPY18583.1 MAG: hypothetical protein A4E74_00520 [Syntrophus sp. PtaB.Bin075]
MNCPDRGCHYRTLTKDLKEEFCFNESCERRVVDHLNMVLENDTHLKPSLPPRRK